uniref:Uncharacterized protein n=1 Tax=Strongyloides stercoralis TaxID=6248 RepID=A0A0K0E0R0_STRER
MQFHHILKRTILSGPTTLRQSSSIFNTINSRKLHYSISKFSEKQAIAVNDKPTTEQLLAIDYTTRDLIPNFFKKPVGEFFFHCVDDVKFTDKLFNYSLVGKDNLNIHIAKVRSYFRYKSPFNKCEYKGSIIYENDNFLTILWQLNTYKSDWRMYIPEFISRRKAEERILEGALEIYINKDGEIFEIINREVTDSDKAEAERLALFKKEQDIQRAEEERKKMEEGTNDAYKN